MGNRDQRYEDLTIAKDAALAGMNSHDYLDEIGEVSHPVTRTKSAAAKARKEAEKYAIMTGMMFRKWAQNPAAYCATEDLIERLRADGSEWAMERISEITATL